MKKNVNVLFFPYWPANPYQPNLAGALREKGVIVKGVKDDSFQALAHSVKNQDILHIHWTNPYMLAPKLSISIRNSLHFYRFLKNQKKTGRKLVWTIHNLGEHEPRHPGFELFCHRLLARLSDGIIVHSRYALEKAVETYRLERQADKIRIIPHGNYMGNYPNDISCDQAREKLGIGAEKKVFLFFGSIREYKGLPELISAFSKIATGSELLILAGNPLHEKIKVEISRLAADREDIIFYPGFIPDEEIQVYMNGADVVVYPFRDIFTSGSVLLAMSFAKPLLVPDIESLEDVKKEGGAITYVPQESNGLEKALSMALSADFQKLGKLNFKAAQKLSWDFIADETARFYSQILDQ